MDYYIRVFSDNSAALINQEGLKLFTFKNLENALIACEQIYDLVEDRVIYDSGEQSQAA